MNILLSLLAFITLVSCGKEIEDRGLNSGKSPNKHITTEAETWIILSERPLPNKIKVLINGMVFFNECTRRGNASVDRTYRNGTIHITSYAAFRQDYFDVDIFDCESGEMYFSQDYVDQTIIAHPKNAPLRVILRLRNS